MILTYKLINKGKDIREILYNSFFPGGDYSKFSSFKDVEDGTDEIESVITYILEVVEDCRIVLIDERNKTCQGFGVSWMRCKRRAVILRKKEDMYYEIKLERHMDLFLHNVCKKNDKYSLPWIAIKLYVCFFMISACATFLMFSYFTDVAYTTKIFNYGTEVLAGLIKHNIKYFYNSSIMPS